ncbi:MULTISPECIES: BcsR/BcsP family cellulose biosynthesis protein [unclassified Pseudoalteromonas]|uniref:BcsR/BcsP family cellulose biosynthesis protein n=1 Tax=Pseudoalteromonas sp. ZZD1 TaxID=3139395 RepID=UPI003BAB2EBE
MHNIYKDQSNILTQYDIECLLSRFGGKDQSYIEIVDVQKNQQIFAKYPLLKEISHAKSISTFKNK